MTLSGFVKNLLDRIVPEKYEFNPYNLHPHVTEAVAHCDQNQWRELSRLFERLDHYQAHLIIEGLSEIIKVDTFFDDWCEKSRGHYLPHLLRGSLLLKRAWVYRGYGRGYEVTDQRAIQFHGTLESSFQSLTEAMNLNSTSSEAPARSIRALMGLSADWDDIDKVYEKMKCTGETNFAGELNYLVASCEKWLGSHEKMFDFARKTFAQENHPSHAGLIAEAHHEMHLYLDRFSEDLDVAESYFENDAVQLEIDDASKAIIDRCAELPLYETVEAHGYFALTYSLAGNYTGAKPHFEFMGKNLSRHPWEFYEEDFLNQSRRDALAKP